MAKLDIDSILDEAGDDDAMQQQIQQLETEKTEMQERLDAFSAKEQEEKEQLEAQELEKDETEVDPVLKQMQDRLDQVEETNKLDAIARVQEGVATLSEEYNELFADKAVMDAPVLEGADITTRQYIEGLLDKGDMTSARKAVETAMKINGIKSISTSDLPRGRGASGKAHEEDEETRKRGQNIKDMFAAMDKGTYASTVAKNLGKVQAPS